MTTTSLLQRPFTPPFYASTKPGDSLLKFASRTATDEVNFNKQQATMMTVEYSNFIILFILTDELINFIQQFSFLFFSIQKNDVIFKSVGHFNLFLNIAWCYKKTKDSQNKIR